MKLTKNQEKELEVWEYFIPNDCDWLPKTEEDIIKFFEKSEQGKHKSEGGTVPSSSGDYSYFNALCWGKIWAGRHWQMYEEGVLEGTMPYFTILQTNDNKPIPRSVVDQMKREMFKGIDAEVIEKVYQEILDSNL